ncbi:MAG: beta-ribofuranosylaminobenzene 5-phosphate synthase [Rhodospirillaceae bacterium]|jgi:beta-ribofuranosylaminobenzene 5'-phosphate synthase|nr:beta-ribofuranosylaminobenzene 5-phosphate synthase [Rhodospirillaceae bacterium]
MFALSGMISARSGPGNTAEDLGLAGATRRAERVTVSVPARLHFGFMDLNGNLGRRFGSLGVALEAPLTRVTLAPGTELEVSGEDADRARQYLLKMIECHGLDPRLRLHVESSIPRHVGLGSGTQLALSVGMAAAQLFDLDADAGAIAQLLDRGARSSVGIATFAEGGVVLDGGRGAADEPPPVLSRLAFPEEWRILLIFDNDRSGLHGEAEREAFRRLPPFPPEQAAHLCRLMLMVAMPALAEQDLARFGGAVTELQQIMGDYFAPAQGARFSSPTVTEALAFLHAEGVAGVGQSSWGPTGFSLVGSEAEAKILLARVRERFPADTGLTFAISRGRNRGGEIERVPLIRS